MCVRCGALKYVYGSSMHPYQESMYVAVIIDVDVVIYVVCKCGGDLTRHQYKLGGVVSQKSWGSLWNWCSWSADWFHQSLEDIMWKRRRRSVGWFYPNPRVVHKIAVKRVRADFIKVQGVFYKIDIKKFGASFAKLPSIDCGLISSKFESFFCCKIYVSNCHLGWHGHLWLKKMHHN